MTSNPAIDDSSIPQDPPSGVRVRDEEGRVSDDERFQAFAAERIDTKSIRRIARAFRLPPDVAEDLTQRALLALWQRRASIAEDRWSAWFFTAMLRGAFSYSRARRRAKKYEPSIALEVFARPDAPTPEAALHLRECEKELRRLVESLRPERRAVVELYLLEELPMKEVAEQLQISLDTAKSRWRSAQEDMSASFRRARAKERFLALIAAFAAFFAAVWRRLVGRGRRGVGPLVACASFALLVASHHGEPSSAEALEVADVEMTMPSSDLTYSFAPMLSTLAERERGHGRTTPSRRVDGAGIEVARVLLVQANASLRDGRVGAARTYLTQYKTAFPRDPDERSARQYVAILAELAAR